MLKSKFIAAAVFAAVLALPGIGRTAPEQAPPQPHQESGAIASTELTAIAIQSITANNVARSIAMRFNPIFDPRRFPVAGRAASAALPDGFTSMACGEENRGVSFWVNGARNKIEDDFAATAYDGYSSSLAVGGDYRLGDLAVAGLSITFADTDIDTPSNAGHSETKGYTLMPYANFILSDWLSADVSVGYAWNDTDMRRVQAGTLVDGSQDSEGWIAVANLNAQKWYNLLFLSAKAGVLYNQDKRSAFTESNGTVIVGRTNNLTQANVGGAVGYWLAPVMPSLSVTYTYDLDRQDQEIAGGGPQPANDKDGLTIGVAVSYYGSGALAGASVALSATTELLREDMTNNGISLNARYAF